MFLPKNANQVRTLNFAVVINHSLDIFNGHTMITPEHKWTLSCEDNDALSFVLSH